MRVQIMRAADCKKLAESPAGDFRQAPAASQVLRGRHFHLLSRLLPVNILSGEGNTRSSHARKKSCQFRQLFFYIAYYSP